MKCELCRAKIRRADRICSSCGALRQVTRFPLATLGLVGGVLAVFLALPLAGLFFYAHKTREMTKKGVRFDLVAIHAVALHWSEANGGQCPTVEQLVAEKELSSASRRIDPWDSPIRIACDGATLHVISDGPDRRPDTSDDVRVSSSEL